MSEMKIGGGTPAVAAGLGVLMLLTSGCSSPAVEIAADYPEFNSIKELAAAADLVVEVEIGDFFYDVLLPGYEGEDPELNPLAGTEQKPAESTDGAVPITVYKAIVVASYSGGPAVGETLEIQQLGGESEGTKVVESDVRSLAAGETVLVFLDEFADAPAAILGGDAGLFLPAGEGSFVSAAASDEPLTVSVDELAER